MTEKTSDLKQLWRKINGVSYAINWLGAVGSFFYFVVIDPLPENLEAFNSFNAFDIFIFLLFLSFTAISGTIVNRKRDQQIIVWYDRLKDGLPPEKVPTKIRRLVLNYVWSGTLMVAAFWGLAGLFFAWVYDYWRMLIGIIGVGGLFTTAASHLVRDLLWRQVIPTFFPAGDLSSVKAVRLSVLGRLLLVFLFIGLLPPGILVSLNWQRIQALTTAANPQAILDNLFALQAFILAGSVAVSIGLAILVTRSITTPIHTLQKAMERVEQNDLEVCVPITTNDELGYLGEHFNQMIAGLRQSELLRNLLNLYVSPQVAREALEHGARLGGELVECTVLFADIRDFTSIAESLPPGSLMYLLNRYMSAMVNVIVARGGIVNKFGGDSLLVVFGTPLNPLQDHAAQAIYAAADMHHALSVFNQTQADRQSPTLRIGIGIATGPVIAGNIGGRERIEYTVIGDTVNLASRLQDKTKELDSNTLLSAQTFESASQNMDISARRLPQVSVKGKRDSVVVYAIEHR